MNLKLVILCITLLILLIPMAGATYDVVSGIASNSTEYTTTANYVELHNISLATGIGTVFIKASWDARMNFTAPLYGRFMRDGASLGRFNLTQSVYAQVGSYELSLNETTGTHYYGWEVYSNKRGTIYSRNFSAVFLTNGTDTAASISALQANDSYFNGTVFPNSTNFKNNSALQISTYSGNFPNTTIAEYNGNYPNSSLINYLLTTTYGGNYPNATVAGNLVNWNATYNSSYNSLLSNAPNTTVAGNLINWNATYNATYDAKEPAISSSTASKFYGWDKTFKDLLISYISGLQGILNTHNSTTDTVNTNLDNWNKTYNTTYDAKMSNPATVDLNMNNYSISNATNISAKNIGGVIYADQYATIQDAINASSGGIVQLEAKTYIINTLYGAVDGTQRVGLMLPANVTLRGQGMGKTIIRQGTNLDSWIFVYLSGKDTGLEDMTIDYNGFAQSPTTSDLYNGAVQLGSQTSSDRAHISNVKILNAVGRWQNATLITIGISLYMSPYATINNVWLDTFDAGILVTRAYDTTKTEYQISNIWAENGTTGAGFALHYEVGNATIRNFYTNNSDPFHVLSGNPTVYNFVSRNPKGDIRIGTDAATTGKYEGIDIDGNGITIVTTSPSIDLINPVVKNSVGYGISINSGGYANILNPLCDNVTNSCINFESNSHGTIFGGNLTRAQQNGLVINIGSSVDVNGLQISNTSLAGSNQFSGIFIGGATSNNSTIRNSKIYTNNLMRYSVEMTGGNNNILENNWLTSGINGYYVLSGSGSSAFQNRNTPGYNHGNSATASTAFGSGDSFYNSTANIQQLYTDSAWDWFLMPSKVFGTGVTNNNNGSITITDSTYNATYDAKEPAISQGVSPQFWMFNKTWQNITTTWITEGTNQWFTNARAISAVQSILNAMNQSSATNNTNSLARDDIINSTKVNKTNAGELSGGTLAYSIFPVNITTGTGGISFSNGTNNISIGSSKKMRQATNGIITGLYVNQTSDAACSGNVTVTSSGIYKAHISWSSTNNASSNGLSSSFTAGEWLLYNMTENTGCIDFTFVQAHTKTS